MKKIIAAAIFLAMLLQGCTVQPENNSAVSAQVSVSGMPSVAASTQQSASVEPSPTVNASQNSIDAAGNYQGQADNNFIEIKIAGQPEDKAYMVFMLTGDIKNNFESLGLKKDDTVEISYYKNADGQLVLTKLIKQDK